MSTKTKIQTLQDALNSADPNQICDALRAMRFGDTQAFQQGNFTSGANAALFAVANTFKIPALVSGEGAADSVSPSVPGFAKSLQFVRASAVGTAALGARIIGDAGATPSATVCAYDPTTGIITFEGTVTGVTIGWYPAPSDPTLLLTVAFGQSAEG